MESSSRHNKLTTLFQEISGLESKLKKYEKSLAFYFVEDRQEVRAITDNGNSFDVPKEAIANGLKYSIRGIQHQIKVSTEMYENLSK